MNATIVPFEKILGTSLIPNTGSAIYRRIRASGA
jgi:hypothetical protein